MKKQFKRYLIVTISTFLMCASFNLFLSPNNFVADGLTGSAIILNEMFGVNEEVVIYVVEFGLLFISYLFLGKKKTKNSILGTILYPIFITLTENITKWIPLSNLDPMVICIVSGFIIGFANGLVYQNDCTTGGTDVLYELMQKYLKIPMAKAMLFIDGPVVLLGCIIFGFNSMIYSLIILYLTSYVSNSTMLKLNNNRVLYIHTKKIHEIKHLLLDDYHYDVTIIDVKGGYLQEPRKMILCTVDKLEYNEIKDEILFLDPGAFLTVTKAYELKNANHALKVKN